MVLAGMLAGCGDQAPETARGRAAAPPVEAVQARVGALPLAERLSGTVWAENQVALFPEINGRIARVLVQNGETVVRGQPLVELQDDTYREQVRQAEAGHRIAQARVRQAQARLSELQAQAGRLRTLGERLVSELELETLSAQLESARADVDLAEAQAEQAAANLAEQRDTLSRTVIRAPIDGLVGQRNAEIGMQASPSTRLFTIGNVERVIVRIHIPDTMMRHVRGGQPVRVLAPAPGAGEQGLRAELTRISPFLNEVARTAEAEIELDNPERWLRPGMFVPVDILYGQSRQATLVPTSALFTDGSTGREGVFVVGAPDAAAAAAGEAGGEASSAAVAGADAGAALSEPRAVEFRTVGIVARGESEVAVDRLEPGEWVVTIGQNLLSTGRSHARVRPVTWEHVMALQGLRREDLLEEVLRATRPGGGATTAVTR